MGGLTTGLLGGIVPGTGTAGLLGGAIPGLANSFGARDKVDPGLAGLLGGSALGGLFGGGDGPASSRRGIDQLREAFRSVLGREPTQTDIDNFIDPKTGEIWGGLFDKGIENVLKESSEFKNRGGGGGGGGAEGFSPGLGGGGFGGFFDKLGAIGQHPLSRASAQVPQSELDFVDARRGDLLSFAQGIRSGDIQAEVSSPEQRQRLLDRASGTFGRQLEQSQAGLFENLNRRGLLPSTSTGFSGPATDVLSEARARIFEDPLTGFTRDLDINNELQRLSRQQNLNDQATGIFGQLLQSGQQQGQFLGNLGLQNLAGQRGFQSGLLGQLLQNEQFGMSLTQQAALQAQAEAAAQVQFDAQQAFTAEQNALNRQNRLDLANTSNQGSDNSSTAGLLGAVGSTLGSFLPIPGGGAIGGALGTFAGNKIDDRKNNNKVLGGGNISGIPGSQAPTRGGPANPFPGGSSFSHNPLTNEFFK